MLGVEIHTLPGDVDDLGGIEVIPALVGVFAVAEVMRAMASPEPPPLPKRKFGSILAGQIHTSPSEVLTKVEVRRNDPAGQYALIASREAWADAGAPEVEPERLGVVVVHVAGDLLDHLRREDHNQRSLS